MNAPTFTVLVGTPIRQVERLLIEDTMKMCKGDKPKAAMMLGISLKTLYMKLHKYEEADRG